MPRVTSTTAKKAASTRVKRTTAAPAPDGPPLQSRKPAAKKAARPRSRRPASLTSPRGAASWMAPAEDQKMKWAIRVLLGLLLVVALLNGEITWTGDGVKIGLHRPLTPHRTAAP